MKNSMKNRTPINSALTVKFVGVLLSFYGCPVISSCSLSLWPSWFHLESIDNVGLSVMTTLRLSVVVTRLLLYAMIKIGI